VLDFLAAFSLSTVSLRFLFGMVCLFLVYFGGWVFLGRYRRFGVAVRQLRAAAGPLVAVAIAGAEGPPRHGASAA